MTTAEYKKALEALTDPKFEQYMKDFGGNHDKDTREQYVLDFVNKVDHSSVPHYERRACYLLGTKTEAEKRMEATCESARAARRATVVSIVSAIIALLALAVAVWIAA